MTSSKCSASSEKFREEGNSLFRNGELFEALIALNKSLCHAEAGSQQIPLAYANRSSVYFEAKNYEMCLENIKLARSNGYEIDELPKLAEREEKCKRLIKSCQVEAAVDQRSFFTLSHSANPMIPFIVNCLSLRESEKFGRYVVTTSDLRPGDVIAIEEPFYKFIDNESRFSRCTNCLKTNRLSLIPCATCSTTMYCSDFCRREHETLIHHVECNRKPLPSVLVVCTEMLLTAVAIAGSLKKLRSLLSCDLNKTVFDYDLSNPEDPSYRKNLLLIVNSMAKSENSRIVITEKMKKIFDAAPFDSLWDTEDEREFLIDCFHNQLRIHNTNTLEMGEHTLVQDSPASESYWYVKTFGSGLCPFASLFNHSCDANIKRTCIDNKIAFVVGKPVAAGEQLFLSYGYSSYKFPRDERQNLLQRFSFTCDCQACVDDFPEMMNLPRLNENFDEPEFRTFSAKAAVAELRKNCDYIEKTIGNHPSYETTTCQIYHDHLLHQISKFSFD